MGMSESESEDVEKLLSPGSRVELRRSRELGRRHLSTYDVSLYDSEQDTIRESMRQRVRESKRGTSPETLFRQMYGMIEEHGGAIVFTTVDDRVVPVTSGSEQLPWFGLDEEERMTLGEMSRGELLEEVAGEIEDLTRDEFVRILEEDAGRDSLLRLVAALRGE